MMKLFTKRPSGPMSDTKRIRAGWVATAMLTFMMLISWADKSVLGLAAGPIMEDLGLSPTQFGAIGSTFFLVFCITPLFVGFIANKVSSKWLMAVLVLMWSVAQAPVLLSASFATLMISRIILGAAEGPSASLMHHHLHKWFKPTERAMPGAVSSSGSTLGLAIAAPVLTFTIVAFGWRETLLIMAVVGMIWTAVWLFLGDDGPLKTYDAAEANVDGTEAAVVKEEKSVPYWRIFTTRTWLGGAIGSHVAYWTMTIYATWLPVYLQQAFGMDLRQVGVIAAIPPLIGFASFIGSGWIVQKLSQRGIGLRWSVGVQMAVTSILSGICLLGFMAVDDQTIKIILMSIAFGLPNCALALVFLSGAPITPVRQRGAVFAYTNVAYTSAGIIAPLLIGMVIQQSITQVEGFHTIFFVLGLALIISGIAMALLINPEKDAVKLGLTAPAPDPAEAPTDIVDYITISETPEKVQVK